MIMRNMQFVSKHEALLLKKIIQYDHVNYFVAKPHDLLVPVS